MAVTRSRLFTQRRGSSVDLDQPLSTDRLAAQLGNNQLDLAIAATALEHGLIVVTRNVSDFEPTGVPVLNPFNPWPR
jgi:predicted nucleic acid-binding protein